MKKNEHEILAQDAALLSLCEVGLGSLLHAFKIPLAGYFLSLNQIFLLARSTFHTQMRGAAAAISTIAAVLKSLSPAGKKLTPMLAISAQGLLFSTGPLLLGPHLVGALIGGILSSAWSFAQPFLVYYFIFGQGLWLALEGLLKKFQNSFAFLHLTSEKLWWALILMILLKALLAAIAVILARTLSETAYQRWQNRLLALAQHAPKRAPLKIKEKLGFKQNLRLAWGDMMNPLFLFSLALTLAFFIFVEASFSKALWHGLRPLAVGFLLFLTIRLLPLSAWAARYPTFALALAKIRKLMERP